MATRTQKTKPQDSLEQVVGASVYQSWVDMLRRLVPDGRTHRLGTLIAGMLQYATAIAVDDDNNQPRAGSVAQVLTRADESGYDERVIKLLMPLVTQLFDDAGVKYRRTSRSGEDYSIAEEAINEYFNWYNMPWE